MRILNLIRRKVNARRIRRRITKAPYWNDFLRIGESHGYDLALYLQSRNEGNARFRNHYRRQWAEQRRKMKSAS